MTRHLRILVIFAAAWFISGGGALVAAAQTGSEDVLARLTAIYLDAVRPGEDAAAYGELYRVVLEQVESRYVREVDAAEFMSAAIAEIAPPEPHSGDPAQVFEESINAALASLDPHS